YVPPKPGQGGWRAPKKTDVISSIPPPSSSSTDRRTSPPPIAPPRRGVSPSPLVQRRGVSPGPLSRQYSTASLGRSAARSVSSILQAVTGNYSSPYGQRHSTGGPHSGYATPSSYSAYGAPGPRTPSLTRSGSFSGSGGAQNFVRSASLRVPSSRRTSGERKARTRDLASDMLASVCLGSSPARGEPEGNEAEDFSSRETTLSPPPFTNEEKLTQSQKPRIKFIRKRGSSREASAASGRKVRRDMSGAEHLPSSGRCVNDGMDSDVDPSGNYGELSDFILLSRETAHRHGNYTLSNLNNCTQSDQKCEQDRNEDAQALPSALEKVKLSEPSAVNDAAHQVSDCNYESEVELEIPTEENFLRSTSASGD
ncbi:hypothetical protein FHG87_024514, partial [Trinorchestia longiramus]